jgi:hypothetical protein
VKAEILSAAIAELRDRGMSDEAIVAGYNGSGPVNLRDAAVQSALLDLARTRLNRERIANRPKPRAPRVQRPGVSGEVTQAPNQHKVLSDRLDKTGSPRDAARLLAARRADARKR